MIYCLIVINKVHLGTLLKLKLFEELFSHETNAIALYYAFALDFTSTFCFLLFHDIKLPPTRTQYPKVERLLLGDPAQLTLEYPTI